MPEDHDALAPPFGVRHVGKVGIVCTEDAAMGLKGLPMHHKGHIIVAGLIHKPGKGQVGQQSTSPPSH